MHSFFGIPRPSSSRFEPIADYLSDSIVNVSDLVEVGQCVAQGGFGDVHVGRMHTVESGDLRVAMKKIRIITASADSRRVITVSEHTPVPKH